MARKPTFFFEDLPDNWEEIIEEKSSEGGFVKEILAEFRIPVSAHNRFMKENPEYRNAIDMGRLVSNAWWLETGRDGISKPKAEVNTGTYAFIMKAIWGYSDRGGKVDDGTDEPKDDLKMDEVVEKFRNPEANNEKTVN